METKFWISGGGRETPCILREPDSGKPCQVVLGVHGIGGSKDDEILVSLAEEMELFGTPVLRIDLPAHGENDEEIMTLQGCVDTVLDAADYLAERYPSMEELCIFATGFGAYTTLTALQELIELDCRVKLVVQAPYLRMDERVLRMTRVSAVTLEAIEMVIYDAPRRPVGIFYSFYEECVKNPALAAYPIPILILHGQNDNVIPMADIQQLRDLNDRSRLVIIPGAGHRFQEPGAWDMALDLTRDWFEFEKVLLADAI